MTPTSIGPAITLCEVGGGVAALARRARLPELRITCDLAFDRVVNRGRLLQFRGESYRVRHALMQEG